MEQLYANSFNCFAVNDDIVVQHSKYSERYCEPSTIESCLALNIA